MQRELPLYHLEGITFQVDVKTAELVEANTPFHNSIKINELEDMGSHYILHWNAAEKNQDSYMAFLRRQPEELLDSDQFMQGFGLEDFKQEQKNNIIKIPPLKELDPQGMSALYGLPLSQLEKMSDFEIMVNQQVLLKRKMGVLPMLRVGQHDFLVNLKMGGILPLIPGQAEFIKFAHLEHYIKPDGSAYLVPWDLRTGKIARTDFHSLTSLPSHVRYVEIPVKENLDPYGYYTMYREEKALNRALRSVPLNEKVEARFLEWSETNLPALIEKNAQQKRNSFADKPVRETKKKRIKRGV